MFKVPATVIALCAAVLLHSACTDPLSPSPVSQTTASPAGSSFKNCKGGRNIHWWVAHIEDVTAADLQALTVWNLTNADRSTFDPSDADTLATWLKEGAKADDIFYALSAQLAGAVLNVRHGFVHESGTFVLVDQANRELVLENPSIGWMEQLLYEFNRCQ